MVLGHVRKFVRFIRNIFTEPKKTAYKKLNNLETADDKWLLIQDEHSVEVVDQEDVPQKVLEEHGVPLNDEENEPPTEQKDFTENEDPIEIDGPRYSKQNRHHKLKNRHPKQVAKQATENHYVLNDLVNNPDFVDAETPGEAIEFVAETNPGWAKLTNVTDIAADADPNVETGTDAADSSSLEAESDVGIGAEVGTESDTSSGDGDFGSDTAGVASGTIDTVSGSMDIETGGSSAGSAGNSAGSGNSANAGTSGSSNSSGSSGT